MRQDAIPTFDLYGEPHRMVAEDFIHLERLDDRSRPGEWTIRPHAHAELAQLILIASGSGTMHADGEGRSFEAPALLAVPATAVHGFVWQNESTGWVLTLAQPYLAGLIGRDAAVGRLFERPHILQLAGDERAQIEAACEVVLRELGWSAPGHCAAVDAALLGLLVIALRRLGTPGPAAWPLPGGRAALVARFRARVDDRFRLREPIADHAAALGVSESRLRAACARVAAAPPTAILDARALLEARRALRYSNLSVAEVGYALGFADPAYFSRFFARHVGVPPRTFRLGAVRSGPRTSS